MLVVVLLALAGIAGSVYAGVLRPSLTQARTGQEQSALVNQAGQAMAAGDYQRTIDLYDQLAQLNPSHPALAPGLARARQALSLESSYQQAQDQLAQDQVAEAQATLSGIQAIAPTYRDVGLLLEKIERRQRLTGLLLRAVEAEKNADLEAAVAALQEARTLSSTENRDAIEAELFDDYLALGAQIVRNSRARPAELKRAADVFGRALRSSPRNHVPVASKTGLCAIWMATMRLQTVNGLASEAQLAPLYAEQPGYLDGKLAALLYDVYLHEGEQALQADQNAGAVQAWQYYSNASQIAGVDTTAARAMLARLNVQMTPTATPEPTATPRPSARSDSRAGVGPAPVPPAKQVGKILYWSSRGQARELWMMDADGQNAARVADQTQGKAEYDRVYQAEQRSPDGKASLSVGVPQEQGAAQVFVSYTDGKSQQVTHYESASYDPVWSPAGHWIAFVSAAMGNDEVFVVGVNGENARRLTNNSWEWDKHPSWSPDGKRIVFWSNRDVGHGQIWVMNADGSAPLNLSQDQYDERDPVWIK